MANDASGLMFHNIYEVLNARPYAEWSSSHPTRREADLDAEWVSGHLRRIRVEVRPAPFLLGGSHNGK